MMLPDSKQTWLCTQFRHGNYISKVQHLLVISLKSQCLGRNLNPVHIFGQASVADMTAGISVLALSDVLRAENCYHPRVQMDHLLCHTHTLFTQTPHPMFFMKQVKTNSVFISIWIFQPCWHNDSNSGKNKKANLLHLAGNVNPRRQHAV